ncbi:MAG: hypothetical protein QXZ22_08920, partial [Sulfolobales archaeon]
PPRPRRAELCVMVCLGGLFWLCWSVLGFDGVFLCGVVLLVPALVFLAVLHGFFIGLYAPW